MSKIKFQKSENRSTKTQSNQILKTTLLTQPRVHQLQNSILHREFMINQYDCTIIH